jgi:hypothetical protein
MPPISEHSDGVVYTYNYNDLDNHVNLYSYNFDSNLHSAFLFNNIFYLDFNVNDILTDIYFRHKSNCVFYCSMCTYLSKLNVFNSHHHLGFSFEGALAVSLNVPNNIAYNSKY